MAKYVAVILLLFVSSLSLLADTFVSVPDLPIKPAPDSDWDWDFLVNCANTSQKYEDAIIQLGRKPVAKTVHPTQQQLEDPTYDMVESCWNVASSLYNQYQREYAAVIYPDRKGGIICGISVGAAVYNLSNDLMSSTVSPAIGLTFNPDIFFGTREYLNLWFDYACPTIVIDRAGWWDYNYPNEIKHNTNTFSIGASLNIPLDRVFRFSDLKWNLKGGVGYFWMNDLVPNVGADAKEFWQGAVVKIETELYNFNTILPVGIYASYSFMNTNEGSMWSGSYVTVPFGDRWIGTINAGLRFFITNTNCK